VVGLAGNALAHPTHTEVGHLTAALTGLAWAPFVPNRDDDPFPRTPTERRDLGSR
jgi:hypothetical protein